MVAVTPDVAVGDGEMLLMQICKIYIGMGLV